MQTVVGIFASSAAASDALERLRRAGIRRDRVSILVPGTPERDVERRVPTDEGEPPGMGAAVTSNVRPGRMDAARAVHTLRESLASRTARRKSGSRTVSTSGAFLRVRWETSLSMVWLAHCTRSSGP